MKTPTIKYALWALLLSVMVWVAALFWGAYFGFPEPDASPEKAAQMRWHSTLSGWLMLLAAGTFLLSCVIVVFAYLTRKR